MTLFHASTGVSNIVPKIARGEWSRRRFLAASAAATAAVGWGNGLRANDAADSFPRFHPTSELTNPVICNAVDVVWEGKRLWVRVRSDNGEIGLGIDNGKLADLSQLLLRRVRPSFLGRDLRDLDQIVRDVYTDRRNYKFAGMPFWASVAYVEMACLDLLGLLAKRPVRDLFGPTLRTRVDIYLSRLTRETTPEEEVRIVAEGVEQTGAKAVKLKIGGRMQNRPQDVERTNRLIPLARKRLGDEIQINVDANGSYSVTEAVETGRMLEAHDVNFFEEPCPWQEHDATRQVADRLSLKIAGGEQDSSFAVFRWMCERKGFQLLQPDVFYNGGLIRTLRVAELAALHGIPVTPHSPKTGRTQHPNLTLAAVLPNLGPYQEYRAAPEVKNGQVQIPRGIGFAWGADRNTIGRLKPLPY